MAKLAGLDEPTGLAGLAMLVESVVLADLCQTSGLEASSRNKTLAG